MCVYCCHGTLCRVDWRMLCLSAESVLDSWRVTSLRRLVQANAPAACLVCVCVLLSWHIVCRVGWRTPCWSAESTLDSCVWNSLPPNPLVTTHHRNVTPTCRHCIVKHRVIKPRSHCRHTGLSTTTLKRTPLPRRTTDTLHSMVGTDISGRFPPATTGMILLHCCSFYFEFMGYFTLVYQWSLDFFA